MESGTLVFLGLVALVGLGLLWFHVLRPMLEAFGVLGVGEYSVSSVSLNSNADYVTSSRRHTPHMQTVSIGGNAEEEKQAEAEAPSEAPHALSSADINALLTDTRDEATARALGVLLGSGLIVPESRTRAMVALFGPAGRKHTRVRSWVDTAEASANAARAADAPPENVRLVTVNAGGPDEHKMVL